MNKTCTKCGLLQPLTNFAIKHTEKDGHSWHCKPCHNQYAKEWYKKNKKLQIAKVKKRKQLIHDEISNYKSSNPCSDCKQFFPSVCMDFDHINDDKIACISQLSLNGNKKAAWGEIAKCELVCANCHRIRTSNRLH